MTPSFSEILQFEERFRKLKLRFNDRLVWSSVLTVEIKLHFQLFFGVMWMLPKIIIMSGISVIIGFLVVSFCISKVNKNELKRTFTTP